MMYISKSTFNTFFINRSSCSEVFSKEGVLRNFAKFTEKHLCQNIFLSKVAGLFLQNTSDGCFCIKITNLHRVNTLIRNDPKWSDAL